MINLSYVSQRFELINNSNSGLRNYLSLVKDSNGNPSAFLLSAENKYTRSSLKDINAFATQCFEQMVTSPILTVNYLIKIKDGLEVIKDRVKGHKKQGFIEKFWFWLRGGNGIVAEAEALIEKITKATESIKAFPDDEQNFAAQLQGYENKDSIEYCNQLASIAEIYEGKKDYANAYLNYKDAYERCNRLGWREKANEYLARGASCSLEMYQMSQKQNVVGGSEAGTGVSEAGGSN